MKLSLGNCAVGSRIRSSLLLMPLGLVACSEGMEDTPTDGSLTFTITSPAAANPVVDQAAVIDENAAAESLVKLANETPTTDNPDVAEPDVSAAVEAGSPDAAGLDVSAAVEAGNPDAAEPDVSASVETGNPDPEDEVAAFEFTSIEIDEMTGNQARVAFSLSDFGTGEIHYGTAESELTSRTPAETSFDYDAHIQRITDLTPDTTYYFQVQSVNSAGELILSDMQTFTTLEVETVPEPVAGNESDSGDSFTPVVNDWPDNTDENLPMSGIFYGTSHGGLQTGNTRLAIEHSLRFRAEKTGHIQSLRWENRRLTQGNVDSRNGAAYDSCRSNNLAPEVCAYMLGNAYSVGNGGQILASIHPDNGNGRPDEETVLGTVDQIYIPSDYPHGVWITQNMSSPVAVVAGGIYHVKLRNLAPPVGKLTRNTLAEARAHDPNTGAMGLNGVWHGNLVGPDSLKWGPYYGRMGQEALYRNATSGSWTETPVTYGWLQFRYTDEVWTGAASTGYDNIQTLTPYSTSAYEGFKIVQGNTRVRQVFTVQTADRVINGMWLNFGHARNATISPLTVELKNAGGEVIASGSITGNSEILSRVNAGFNSSNLTEINVKTWGYTDLPETRLQTGDTYYLELSAGNNAGFHINSFYSKQENRNNWEDAFAEVNRGNGREWEIYDNANGHPDRDLPIMFTLQGMPKQLP